MCNTEKPLTSFYKNARMKDGHNIYCSECFKSRYYTKVEVRKVRDKSTYRGGNYKVRIPSPTGVFKICPKCKSSKDLDEFHLVKKTKDGRAAYCRVCYQKRWRDINPNREYKRKENKFDELEYMLVENQIMNAADYE